MADRDGFVRMLASGVLKHHKRGHRAEALKRAVLLARAYPNSTPALNLAASLHTHAATAAWEERAPRDDEAASASVVRHRRAAVEAYAAASRIAPNCAMNGGVLAEALANDHLFPDSEAMRELARVNPNSTPALNLAASLHTHAATAAWEERAPGDDEAASASVARHRRAAVDAYAAAARIAPRCAMTGGMHAEALANDHRFPEAMRELNRVLSMPINTHDDPKAHHIVYDLIDSGAKERKRDAEDKARALMERLAERINNEIVPRRAAELLRAGAAVGQLRLPERAKLLAEAFPYSSRAQLLRVYVELEQGRALDEPMRRKAILLRVLGLVSNAAGSFDSSLLIALVHAKVLFALDKFDESEAECRRALGIQEPTDPSLDDIPPAVSVPGADCDARVLSLRKDIRVLHNQIIAVAAKCWSSIQTTQHRDRVDRVISVMVDTMHQHYDGIDKRAAKTLSDAVGFRRTHNSWSFFICPNSGCDGKKFVDTDSLWDHFRRHHRKDKLWNKLQSVLDPVQNESATKDDHSLDGITLSQDSEQRDILNLPRVQDMFESLLRSSFIGIQAEPLAKMRRRKCREGAVILKGIKKKLRMLPKDKLSTEFEEFCLAIKNMWRKVLEISALDLREAILPLARSFQWLQMKRSIALSAKDFVGIIGGADIDAVFDKAPGPPDHQIGDKGADETLKAAETFEESLVRINVPYHIVLQPDAEAYFRLGVHISNLGTSLTHLNDGLDEFSRAVSQYLPYVETFAGVLGGSPTGLLLLTCIQFIKYVSEQVGTTSMGLAFGGRLCTQVGFHLQGRHPSAQTGGRPSACIREIVTVHNIEEADEVIEEWRSTSRLVLVDVDAKMGSNEALIVYERFHTAKAYDLIKDASVLMSKLELNDDDSEWVIA